MKDEIEFTLKSTLTEEQIDLITDAEFEHTNRIWFHTPKGKRIEFVKAQQWIPVSEMLPDSNGYVIVTDYDETNIARRFDGRWVDCHGDKMKDVTAWMPLPEPYKAEREDKNESI